jgi:hypothetical protein
VDAAAVDAAAVETAAAYCGLYQIGEV